MLLITNCKAGLPKLFISFLSRKVVLNIDIMVNYPCSSNFALFSSHHFEMKDTHLNFNKVKYKLGRQS